MKVVAFNGSPRKEGNTHLLIQRVFGELKAEGIETESLREILWNKRRRLLTGFDSCPQG